MSALDVLSEAERAALHRFCERVQVPPGETIVHEGAHDRALYLVVEGEGRLRRADLDLGVIGPGDHFGELGLVAGRPRAASVIASTQMTLARLGLDGWRQLLEKEPRIAARLLEALVDRLGTQLTEMTDSVGDLLRQRSLPRRARVEVRANGETREVRTGTPLGSLLPTEVDGARVVAALLDRTAVSLSTPLSAPGQVEPLLASHWEGQRVVRDSVNLVLLEAANSICVRVRIGASMGSATWIELEEKDRNDETLAALSRAMHELVERDVAIREEWWTVEEARAELEEWGWKDAAQMLSIWREPMVQLVTCGRVYALRNGVLVPRTSYVKGFELRKAEGGAVVLAKPGAPGVERALSPWAEVMREHDRWVKGLGVTSVGTFARACIEGEVSQIIRVAEGWHEKRLGQIADAIAGRAGVRVVCIAGPSSSGKTTFIKRLRVQLQVVGIESALVSLDDYYVDRAKTPRSADGEYDYEALEALDLVLLREHVARMLAGHSVQTARYDFVSGTSKKDGGKTISLGPGHVLMLEGIHGLNPKLLGEALPPSVAHRIFIQPMTSLPIDALTRVSPSDLRLIRRIVRDRHSRGASPADNIMRWPSVRTGERAHIFPFLNQADVVFDTSLVYEPSVLKIYAERYLLEVPREHPAHATAERLRTLIDRFVAIREAHVPPTSILREFIGESGFEY
ncbi:MAG: cyclic nucleotide-binding domain-containing protein [Polyangiales bacterium]